MNCPKSQCETEAKVEWCVLCNSWWHVECMNEINLNGKAQKDSEAMDVEFYCMKCNS